MPSPSSPLATWWINVWIIIGTATFLLIVILPAILFSSFTQERHRFDQCRDQKRFDCQPSMIWYFSGWSGPTSTVSGVSGLPSTATSTLEVLPASSTAALAPLGSLREERSSEKAPTLTSIEVTGASLVQGVYQLPPATTTKMHWTIKANASTTAVSLYTLQGGGVEAKPVRVLALKKQKDGSYQGDWSFSPTPVSLEIRATGAKAEQQSLFFGVAPTP